MPGQELEGDSGEDVAPPGEVGVDVVEADAEEAPSAEDDLVGLGGAMKGSEVARVDRSVILRRGSLEVERTSVGEEASEDLVVADHSSVEDSLDLVLDALMSGTELGEGMNSGLTRSDEGILRGHEAGKEVGDALTIKGDLDDLAGLVVVGSGQRESARSKEAGETVLDEFTVVVGSLDDDVQRLNGGSLLVVPEPAIATGLLESREVRKEGNHGNVATDCGAQVKQVFEGRVGEAETERAEPVGLATTLVSDGDPDLLVAGQALLEDPLARSVAGQVLAAELIQELRGSVGGRQFLLAIIERALVLRLAALVAGHERLALGLAEILFVVLVLALLIDLGVPRLRLVDSDLLTLTDRRHGMTVLSVAVVQLVLASEQRTVDLTGSVTHGVGFGSGLDEVGVPAVLPLGLDSPGAIDGDGEVGDALAGGPLGTGDGHGDGDHGQKSDEDEKEGFHPLCGLSSTSLEKNRKKKKRVS
jgi:hypothetical protein